MEQPSVVVVIIEPSSIFREGLVRVLNQAGFHNCSAFDNAEQISMSEERCVFLADFGNDPNAIGNGVRNLRSRFSGSRIIVICDHYSDRNVAVALRSGADALLLKLVACQTLIKSIELVLLGERIFPARVLDSLLAQHRFEDIDHMDVRKVVDILSAREIDVLECLSEGSVNKVIARQCGISEATVKVHVKAILRKIQAKNRTEAAIWGREHGLLGRGRTAVHPGKD
jgi:two-component system nitrate/nitrite response regulator NarL